MKLIVHYNRHNFIVLTLLFILSGIASYTLTKKVLLYELDESLGYAMEQTNAYVQTHHALPAPSPYDNTQVSIVPSNEPVAAPRITNVENGISVKGRKHIGHTLTFFVALDQQHYKIIISKPVEGIRHITYTVMLLTMAMILVLLLMLAIVNRFVVSRLWRPFYSTLNSLKNFRLNNTSAVEFKKSNIEEFSIMNEQLQLVTANASKEYRLLKEFTENASHEFQTPLAIIRSKLDVLIQQDNLTEEQTELVAEAYSAVTRLSGLSRSLLLLTKIENNQFSDQQELSLHHTVQRKVSQFEELWEDSDISYSLVVSPVFIKMNGDLLEILLNNIFSNASRHNRPGGMIRIVQESNVLHVSNTGNGGALDSEKLFSRFYKDAVNNDNNGLGLSIVKQICIASGISPYYEYKEGLHTFSFHW
ncbi:HAMP domain-containing sensor histidine kinase [Chitinophaga sp. Cy-1792]|uniref:sensor histidine kinase n=1 Tax=Chitinophaga sp. Cy-1792 TaxID=2608339 RepID=UPI0014230AD3|nr:HAMP domain-containing sensor histidine kinase [Chitinophaga sp. Cy-1792]NIG55862.1 HAMP domain-containing histidine kinase [Chitinophaga sp. Cy-1792]